MGPRKKKQVWGKAGLALPHLPQPMQRCRVWRVRDAGEGAQEPGEGRQVRSDLPCHSAPSSRVSNAEVCSSTLVRCLTDHTRHTPALQVIAN